MFQPEDAAADILAAIVESSDDAIIAVDLTGIVQAWNRGAERMYGYAPADIIGGPISRIIPPEHAGELDELSKRITAGERVQHYETVRAARDGRKVDVSLSISPIRNAAGVVVGASTIARDITAKKRNLRKLVESEERLRSIVDAAVDGIIVIDARGRIEAFNPGAERLFGYTEAEVTGQSVNMLMPSPYREEHDGYMARYLKTGEARIIGIGREVSALRKDGSTFPVHLSVGEMSLHGERKFTGILHDLSSRVQMEEQLREQAALVRLGEMAAVIAHEVKNPLAAVRGAIQVIGNRLPAGSREADVMTDVIARIDTLNNLVKDLLLFARPPKPNLMPLDLAGVLGMTVALLSQDGAHAGVHVNISGSARPVMADAELMKIVFINLLVNSAQAMKGKGSVDVAVGEDGGMCRVVVSDTGPGIPPEVRERLFTPFVTTKARGTGLGLSTVRRLIEAHHGHVKAESPSTGGTRITITLPLASA